MSRECFSLETEGRIDARHSAPFAGMVFCLWASSMQPRMCSSVSSPLRSTTSPFLKRQQAECAVVVPTMVLSETSGSRPGLIAFLGYAREHRVARETRLKPNPSKDTYPRTRALPGVTIASCVPAMAAWLSAQAACGFSLFRSKLSPFFHRIKAIAAILRASVSCAISGLMPAASRC